MSPIVVFFGWLRVVLVAEKRLGETTKAYFAWMVMYFFAFIVEHQKTKEVGGSGERRQTELKTGANILLGFFPSINS